jgi:hypothetical protein
VQEQFEEVSQLELGSFEQRSQFSNSDPSPSQSDDSYTK